MVDPQVQERLEKLRRLKQLREAYGVVAYRPSSKQALFHAAAGHKHRYLRTGNRFGKALENSTPVLTPLGWQEIGSLMPGSVVFDRYGRETKVTAVYPQGVKSLYTLTFDDGLEIEACGEHLWICKSPKERWHTGNWIVRSTKEILDHVGEAPSPKQRYTIPLCNFVQFSPRSLRIAPYVMGCLLGDGSLSKSGISLTSFDQKIVDRFARELPACSKLSPKGREGQYCIVGVETCPTSQGTISSTSVKANLDAFGLLGCDSYSKFIPQDYLLNSVENRIALLQGLFDTDGSVYANGKAIEYVSCSAQLMGGVQFLLGSLGLTFSTVHRVTKDNNGTECYSYRLLVHKAPAWLFHLSRKANLVNTEPKTERIIYSIKPSAPSEATCITVDSPDQSFLTKHFIVTHNSTCGAAEDCSFALGARLWCAKDDPVRQLGIPRRATKGVILVADWDKAREIFTSPETGKLMAMLPKDRVEACIKNQAGEVSIIKVKNIWGTISTIELDTVRSFMANPLGGESSQWDWIHVDEPIPEAMWKAYSRGLMDTKGSSWFTCTPISEQWINEFFLPVKMMKSSFDSGFSWEQKPECWIMTGSSYDNPTLDKAEVDLYAKTLSESERASRIYGLPKNSQGLVYPEFDQEKHVYTKLPLGWKDFDEPPDNYTVRVFIDPHPRTPHAVQFWATAPTGQSFMYQELFSPCYIEDLCTQIHSVLKGRTPWQIIMDPLGFIPNPINGQCYADIFISRGLNVLPAPKELSTGIQKAKQELAKPGNLFFNSACSRTLREFYTYCWDKGKEKPVDKDDHMMECFYRACVVGLDWVDFKREELKQEAIAYQDNWLDLSPLGSSSLTKLVA